MATCRELAIFCRLVMVVRGREYDCPSKEHRFVCSPRRSIPHYDRQQFPPPPCDLYSEHSKQLPLAVAPPPFVALNLEFLAINKVPSGLTRDCASHQEGIELLVRK